MATSNNIGTINKPYVSAVDLLDEREIAPLIIDLQDDAAWTQLMIELGRREKSKIFHFDSFYNNPKFIIIDTTGATVSNSGTATVTVTNLSSGNNNYIIVGDTVLLPNGKNALVTTLSTTTLANDTIVMKSVDGSNLTLVAGDKLSVIGTAMEEGSAANAARRFNVSKLRNNIQIFSEVSKITDVQAMSVRTVTVDGDPHVLPQAILDALQLMMGKMAATAWAGQPSTTLFSDASPDLAGPTGAGVQTTRGIDSYVTTYGVSANSLTPGEILTADIDDLCDSLTAVKAPTDYLMVGGNGPSNVIDNYLMNLGSSGAQSVRLQGSNGVTNFTATGFKKGGFNFEKIALKLLSNPQIFNYVADATTGAKQSIARSLYLLPKGKCPTYGTTQGQVDYFRQRYVESAPGTNKGIFSNGLISEIHTGALAPQPTNDTMYWQTRFIAQMGMECFKPQVFAKWIVQ